VLMVKGAPTVLVRYELEGGDGPLELRVRPLLAFREADALTRENVDLDPEVSYLDAAKRSLRLRPYPGLPTLALALAGDGRFEADPLWYRDIEYQVERERGYDDREDNFSPGQFRVRLEPGRAVIVAATLREPPVDLEQLWTVQARARVARVAELPDGARGRLEAGADDFLYRARD